MIFSARPPAKRPHRAAIRQRKPWKVVCNGRYLGRCADLQAAIARVAGPGTWRAGPASVTNSETGEAWRRESSVQPFVKVVEGRAPGDKPEESAPAFAWQKRADLA